MSRWWPGPSRQLLRRLRKPSSFPLKPWRDSLETDRIPKLSSTEFSELNLEPKLILFPRNQPQWINSSYASSVKSFRRSDSFESGAFGFAQSPDARFSRWIELAETHGAELIARPFSKETLRRGVIPEFLQSIGISSSQFRDRAVRRNEAVGPFTVSVAREVLRSIGKEMTWLQAKKCKVELAKYLRQNKCTDSGYCGLSTALARHVEEELRSDNDVFAQRVWGKSWADVFAADVTEEFTPNDFEMRRPDWFTARRLRRAITQNEGFRAPDAAGSCTGGGSALE